MGARASEHEVKEKRGTLTASQGDVFLGRKGSVPFPGLGKPVFV